ncbi:hypothetical protein D3C81_2077380 [compost metagenome]
MSPFSYLATASRVGKWPALRCLRVCSAELTAKLLASRLRFCFAAVSTHALASFGAGGRIGNVWTMP